jgi:hypothetical protein
LYREVEALRLRNQLDPKRFYRKDEGEGKGIKGLPKYFAVSLADLNIARQLIVLLDWYRHADNDAVWDCQRRQSDESSSEANARRRIDG